MRAARAATRRYEQLDAKMDDARAERDRAIRDLAEATSIRKAGAELGIAFARVQQMVRRARALDGQGG